LVLNAIDCLLLLECKLESKVLRVFSPDAFLEVPVCLRARLAVLFDLLIDILAWFVADTLFLEQSLLEDNVIFHVCYKLMFIE